MLISCENIMLRLEKSWKLSWPDSLLFSNEDCKDQQRQVPDSWHAVPHVKQVILFMTEKRNFWVKLTQSTLVMVTFNSCHKMLISEFLKKWICTLREEMQLMNRQVKGPTWSRPQRGQLSAQFKGIPGLECFRRGSVRAIKIACWTSLKTRTGLGRPRPLLKMWFSHPKEEGKPLKWGGVGGKFDGFFSVMIYGVHFIPASTLKGTDLIWQMGI